MGTPTLTPTLTPTPTPTPTITPTPTPVSDADYIVDYVINSDWGSGETISVTIQNNSSTPINGWNLTWTFPGNQRIDHLWNGSYNQNGVSVSVQDAGYNATISANGGKVSFGFNLSYSGSNSEPTRFTLNGTACTTY